MRIFVGQDKGHMVAMEENMKFENLEKCLLGCFAICGGNGDLRCVFDVGGILLMLYYTEQ